VTRDVIQRRLFGSLVRELGGTLGESVGLGTGTIPLSSIHTITPRPGLPGAIESAVIKHTSGGYSQLWLKSYEMKREAFAGSEIEICWLDEEPESAIYTEALTRLMTTGGSMMITATPLYGLTQLMRAFYDEADHDDQRTLGNSRLLVTQTWAQTPHLSEEEKQRTLKSYSPHELKARTKASRRSALVPSFRWRKRLTPARNFSSRRTFRSYTVSTLAGNSPRRSGWRSIGTTGSVTSTRSISASSRRRMCTRTIFRGPASGFPASSIPPLMPLTNSMAGI
jgi:phage terminase large subunit-like protein